MVQKSSFNESFCKPPTAGTGAGLVLNTWKQCPGPIFKLLLFLIHPTDWHLWSLIKMIRKQTFKRHVKLKPKFSIISDTVKLPFKFLNLFSSFPSRSHYGLVTNILWTAFWVALLYSTWLFAKKNKQKKQPVGPVANPITYYASQNSAFSKSAPKNPLLIKFYFPLIKKL